MKKSKKTLVVDTSVLLYDKNSLMNFKNSNIVLPMVVLDELDKHKTSPGILGENARFVNRFLDNLREFGNLNRGVILAEINSTISVKTHKKTEVGLAKDNNDNQIIFLALELQESNLDGPTKLVKVITKDINFRVKCDALGLKAQDYYTDNVDYKSSHYSGVFLEEVSVDLIDALYEDKFLLNDDPGVPEDLRKFPENSCINFKNGKHSVLTVFKKDKFAVIQKPEAGLPTINPRNREQRFALHLLEDPAVHCITLTGIAGSGKTYLSLMAGVKGLWAGKYKKIIFTRALVPVGRSLGYLPGTIDEKMAPWIKPITDQFSEGTDKDATAFEQLKSKGQIEISPLSYIRGRTFNDAYIIVDEAQNASIHELKTIITRAGKNTKIVLLGDIDQVDTPYLNSFSNGLSIVINKFKDEEIAGHVTLPRGERSELATKASKLL